MADKLTAEEIINAWRKGRISAELRDNMLRAEGYELAKDQPSSMTVDQEAGANLPRWQDDATVVECPKCFFQQLAVIGLKRECDDCSFPFTPKMPFAPTVVDLPDVQDYLELAKALSKMAHEAAEGGQYELAKQRHGDAIAAFDAYEKLTRETVEERVRRVSPAVADGFDQHGWPNAFERGAGQPE